MVTDDLNVHDVTVQQTSRFTASGGVLKVSRVTFWVGRHGPFSNEYETQPVSTEQIQNDIQKQVQQLRVINSIGQGA